MRWPLQLAFLLVLYERDKRYTIYHPVSTQITGERTSRMATGIFVLEICIDLFKAFGLAEFYMVKIWSFYNQKWVNKPK